MQRDTSPANQILSPEIGFVHGISAVYKATVDNPPSPSGQVEIAFEAAKRGNATVVVEAITNEEPSSSDSAPFPSLQARDIVLDGFQWRPRHERPSDPRRRGRGCPRCSWRSRPRRRPRGRGRPSCARRRHSTHDLVRSLAEARRAAPPARPRRRSCRSRARLRSVRATGCRAPTSVASSGSSEANGIAVTREYPQRSQLDARANVATLARFFRVGFRGYPDSTGSRFLAPTREPRDPALAPPVRHGGRRPRHAPARALRQTCPTARSGPPTPRSPTTSRRCTRPGSTAPGSRSRSSRSSRSRPTTRRRRMTSAPSAAPSGPRARRRST